MEPLVSIIIPVYNAEKWLSESIESALNQTYQNKEIIIIDDGSKDKSFAVAKLYESEKVKIFQQENKGGSAARNYGFKLSKGDFIQYLDADDIIDKGKIESQLDFVKELDNVVSFTNWCYLSNSKEGLFFEVSNPELNFNNNENILLQLLKQDNFIANHCFLWPRVVIERVGIWNESLNRVQDAEFFIRSYFERFPFKFLNKPLAFYRKDCSNNATISSSENLDKVKSKIYLLDKTEELLIKNNLISEFKLPLSKKYNKRAIEAIWHSEELAQYAFKKSKFLSNSKEYIPSSMFRYILGRKLRKRKAILFFDQLYYNRKRLKYAKAIKAYKQRNVFSLISNFTSFAVYTLLYRPVKK